MSIGLSLGTDDDGTLYATTLRRLLRIRLSSSFKFSSSFCDQSLQMKVRMERDTDVRRRKDRLLHNYTEG